MAITYVAKKAYLENEERKAETVRFFNESINYRPNQPKAIKILDSTETSVKFLLDDGSEIWREWW